MCCAHNTSLSLKLFHNEKVTSAFLCEYHHSPLHLTHLALVHVPGTLVVIGERDEVGDHTQQAVGEELLVSGNTRQNLILKDGNVHEDLEKRKDKEVQGRVPDG